MAACSTGFDTPLVFSKRGSFRAGPRENQLPKLLQLIRVHTLIESTTDIRISPLHEEARSISGNEATSHWGNLDQKLFGAWYLGIGGSRCAIPPIPTYPHISESGGIAHCDPGYVYWRAMAVYLL